jgi:hypothetical protein
MPQFVATPGSNAAFLDTATSTLYTPEYKPKPQQPSTPSTTSAPSGPTAAEKAAADKKRRDAARKKAADKRKADAAAAAEAKANQYNPLMTPFLSPADIRKQAEDLANVGAPSESYLRAQGAQQVAGLGGLTDALTSRLGAVNAQNVAGIAGMQRLYSDIANQAQSAGTSAAAAAGANPNTAPVAAANPMAIANMANLTAQTAGLVPAAGAIGLGLQAQAGSNLTKALVERANRISGDTAKYLRQIQDQEYQKATAQQTLEQNAALLGFKEKTLAADIGYKQGQLALGQQRNTIALQKLANQVTANAQKYGAASKKTLNEALQTILDDPAGLVAPYKKATGLKKYSVMISDALGATKSQEIYGATPEAALATLGSAKVIGTPVDMGAQTVDVAPTRGQILDRVGRQVVRASQGRWSLQKAQNWLLKNVPDIANLTG